MYYASIGLLAALILIIENHDILFRRAGVRENPTLKLYRSFLCAVLVYYVTDVLWGVLDSCGLTALLFIDTEVYYAAMALGVLLWTRYVIAYLEGKNVYAKLLAWVGYVFAGTMIAFAALNIFTPVLFWFDADGAYHACAARHILLIVQVLLFLLSSVYSFLVITRKKTAASSRYRAITLFGLAMAILLAVQLFYPLLPLYSAGYLLGTCLLHSFVFGDEKAAYQHNLEQALEREKQQREALVSAQMLAHTDGLTSVRNKLAYTEMEAKRDQEIAEGTAPEFAIAVFDLNRLKEINDRMGHEAGDRCIVEACRLICTRFKHSPVFRIGGDEFAAFLEGADFAARVQLMGEFDAQIEENGRSGGVVVAGGYADFNREEDGACEQVFERADRQMYLRKRALKAADGAAENRSEGKEA